MRTSRGRQRFLKRRQHYRTINKGYSTVFPIDFFSFSDFRYHFKTLSPGPEHPNTRTPSSYRPVPVSFRIPDEKRPPCPNYRSYPSQLDIAATRPYTVHMLIKPAGMARARLHLSSRKCKTNGLARPRISVIRLPRNHYMRTVIRMKMDRIAKAGISKQARAVAIVQRSEDCLQYFRRCASRKTYGTKKMRFSKNLMSVEEIFPGTRLLLNLNPAIGNIAGDARHQGRRRITNTSTP